MATTESDLKDSCELKHKRRDIIAAANFKFMTHDVRVMLFKAHCCVLYGSQAWDLSTQSAGLRDLEASWRRSARSVLGHPWRTRSLFVPLLLNQDDLMTELQSRFAKMINTAVSNGNVSVKMNDYDE